jgi:hypothetical protein
MALFSLLTKTEETKVIQFERIRKEGVLRFVLTRGLFWGLTFFALIRLLFAPPLTWYFLLGLCCGANLVWNLMRWFILNWWYDPKNKNSMI